MDEETCVCFIDIPDYSEKAFDIICHFPCPFFLSGPFIRCLCSWYLPLSGKMTAFIFPVWIVNSSVVLFMCAHYYPFLCTVYAGNDVGGFLGSVSVATCLAMRLWPFSCLHDVPCVRFFQPGQVGVVKGRE